ncbi:MAG: hypothetical protein ACOX6P_07710 [Candidatus Merdivicinus sp.]|jgi:hypothetical protein
MKNWDCLIRKKAARSGILAFFLLLIPILLRVALKLQTGMTHFAGATVGYASRSGSKSRFLFCSTDYQPDWNLRQSKPLALRAICFGLAGLIRDVFCK